MADLTYDDFKNRVNIQDLLVDAGYQLNRRDGLRYPSYVRIGSDESTATSLSSLPMAYAAFSHLNARTIMLSASSRSILICLPNTVPECRKTDW
jgi:hypothetical protein